MKIKAVSATINKFMHCGKEFAFTNDQLEKMASSSIGALITDNFNKMKPPYGKIIDASVVNGNLIIKGELIKESPYLKTYLVPGCIMPDFKIFEFGLTGEPADKTLTPIEI